MTGGWPWDGAAGGGSVVDVVDIIPGRPLVGRLRVPGDKSVSHRALLLAAVAEGTSVLRGLSDGDDVRRTALAMAACGAAIAVDPEEGERGIRVTGGSGALHEPDVPIDLGNSGTGMRLMAGWVAAHPWFVVLHGDEYLSRRPMDRVAEPLRLMGARVNGRDGGRLPPLAISGGDLVGIDYALPVASAQIKGAVLLAGLGATGVTTVREPAPLRAHTEELLELFGADVTVADGGATVSVRPSVLRAVKIDVPGDPSQAAFWVVAASIVPGSDVTIDNVYVGRGRAGFLDVLRRMGADIDLTMRTPATADIRVRHAPLRATTVAGEEVAGLIDEIPALAVAGACAAGVTEFRDAAELRVKETDRVATVVGALTSLGAAAEPLADGLVVSGPGTLRGATVDALGDHRIAMAAAVAALVADVPSRITGWAAVATSYPGFAADLEALQA
jgi:3-phosphoshikimate 1-carboxyvinyltransferase